MEKIIIANWKMKLSVEESLRLASEINLGLKKLKTKNKVIICPDYISLPLIMLSIDKHYFSLGAQNSATELKAAATGEVSASNLRDIGADYVILGHSERRLNNLESNKIINLKIKAALEAGLKIIFCLGEDLAQRQNSKARVFILKQLRESLKNLKLKKGGEIIIAYEPVWAIGSGQAMTAMEADKLALIIKSEAKKILAKNVKVLYGGSVDQKNAQDFLQQKNISGLLVGGASLAANKFLAICSI